MVKAKTKERKKLHLSIYEVENGYTAKLQRNSTDAGDWDYSGTTHVFLTANALIEYIETLF